MESYNENDQIGAIEAARVAHVHPRTIIAWIRNGWLPALKRPGSRGKYLIRYGDIAELVNRPYKPRRQNTDGSKG